MTVKCVLEVGDTAKDKSVLIKFLVLCQSLITEKGERAICPNAAFSYVYNYDQQVIAAVHNIMFSQQSVSVGVGILILLIRGLSCETIISISVIDKN